MALDKILEVDSLSVALPPGSDREQAIENIDFSIYSGETLCLVGESGSGKSVTGQAILGMLPGTLKQKSGKVLFQGRPLPDADSLEMQKIRGSEIAMIFQEPQAALNPIQRVGRQVEEVFKVHGQYSKTQSRTRVLDLFDSVGLPNPIQIYRSYPHQLSGGQCQRVVIATALALQPKLLIADEPTTALDVTTQAGILELINELKRSQNAAILFITHDFGVVAEVADHVLVMRDGVSVEAGSRNQIFEHPRNHYTRTLLRSVPDMLPPENLHDRDSELVLRAESVSRIYSKTINWYQSHSFNAVENVSFSLKRGQTLGIVGESGCGKSTLLRCILRLEAVDSGRIFLGDREITHASEQQLQPLRKKIQVVLQDPYTSLNPRQKILNAIAEGPIIHGKEKRDAHLQALALLDSVGLNASSADRYPHEFSGGQRQRICIARALALEPEILLADEAVSALDVSIQAQILDLLRDLQRKFGFAILFVTHDLRVAASLCDELIVMRQGKMVEYGPTADLFRTPQSDYTRSLLHASPGKDIQFSAIALDRSDNALEVSK
ncbi:MAG: ABC transporter ATP-binding protein [SAR324 cluster bacterium]|nr:ABC transporter ATP-binding protein [SAR324 cluster bacterium]